MENMVREIIEALTHYYDEEQDLLADCLLYLKSADNAQTICENTLMELDRCPDCGTEFVHERYKEWHSEISTYEWMDNCYCPYCNKKY